MATSSSRRRSNLNRVDRISGLPDYILHRILAFLPTKSAMATSVLSRRWEYVWTGAPVLNFTYDPGDIVYNSVTIPVAQYQSLKHYMNRVLLHNTAPCLQRVDFAVLPVMTEKDRREWFKVLSRRSVKELNLFYAQYGTLCIMLLLDGSLGEHLVALRLQCVEYNLRVTFTCMVHLPRLEKIHLQRVDHEPLRTLIHASPRLRELNILEHICVINFSCSTLKILRLSTAGDISGTIRVPNLEYFELIQLDLDFFYGIHWYRLILADDMQHLAEAKVDCSMTVALWSDLFQTLRHVIRLNVSINPIDETCDPPENTTVHLKLPYFNRLKCLEVHCIEDHCVPQTRMLLKHMPNCVSLIIHMVSSWSSDVDELKGWPEVDSVGLGLHIENIEINDFGRNKLASVELLKYLLVCCTKLKEVKLHLFELRLSAKQKNVMRKMIMRLSRPSGCKIIINDPAT